MKTNCLNQNAGRRIILASTLLAGAVSLALQANAALLQGLQPPSLSPYQPTAARYVRPNLVQDGSFEEYDLADWYHVGDLPGAAPWGVWCGDGYGRETCYELRELDTVGVFHDTRTCNRVGVVLITSDYASDGRRAVLLSGARPYITQLRQTVGLIPGFTYRASVDVLVTEGSRATLGVSGGRFVYAEGTLADGWKTMTLTFVAASPSDDLCIGVEWSHVDTTPRNDVYVDRVRLTCLN